jgi:hypothetical protein
MVRKEYKIYFNFTSLLFLFLFFPSITFGILKAEIFPWALVISILYIKRYSLDFIFLFLFLFLNTVLSMLYFNLDITSSARSLLPYLNVLFTMLIVTNRNYIKFIYLIKGLLIFLLILGFLQYSGVLSNIDFIFKTLVPRASSESLSFINRGVTLLSSEPARAGNVLIFIYLSYRIIFINSLVIRAISDLLILVYLLIIIKSAMASMFFILFLILTYRSKLILPTVLIIILTTFTDLSEGGRVIELFITLSSLDNFEEIVTLLINTSGHRLLSIYAFYNYGFNELLGGGIGNWMNSSIDALYQTGYNISRMNYFIRFGNGDAVSIRGSGFVTNLVLDTGLIGLLLFSTYIGRLLKRYWNISEDSKILIIIFLIKILFVGSVGHPVAWITTFATLKYLYFKNKENK